MSQKISSILLGIDGGGTKTECWLYDSGTPHPDPSGILGQGFAGPSNPRSVGLEVACRNIAAAIRSAQTSAGTQLQRIAAGVIGLAGVGRLDIQQAVTDWARSQEFAEVLRVVPDYELVLAAGDEDSVGVALIGGTGSVAFGRNEQRDTAQAGGWGHLIDDGGSGYAIGQAALKQVCRRHDRRCDLGELGRRLLKSLDAQSPTELPARIHAAADPRSLIASLAVEVFAASSLDLEAQSILTQAASDLSALIAVVMTSLWSEPPSRPVTVAGSLLVHNEEFRQRIGDCLKDDHGIASRLTSVPHPVAGAIRLARQAIAG